MKDEDELHENASGQIALAAHVHVKQERSFLAVNCCSFQAVSTFREEVVLREVAINVV